MIDQMATVDGTPPSHHSDERATLREFLEIQRATFARKVVGLTAEQMQATPLAPSPLSMLGLLRHHGEGERWLFHKFVGGRDFEPLEDGADFAELGVDPELAFLDWADACETSRQIEAAATNLEVACGSPWDDDATVSLRWMLLHAIEEYARHNGHADLLREHLDGATGY